VLKVKNIFDQIMKDKISR